MRTLQPAFLVLLASCILLVPAEPAQAQATRSVDRTVDLDSEGHLEIKAFTGSIDVTTWDRAAVDVQVQIEAENSERADEVKVQIEGSEQHQSVEVDYDALEGGWSLLGLLNIGGDGGDKPPAHVTIRMPRTAGLSIEDFSSTIDVRDLEADLSVQAFSSPIHLNSVTGRTDIETFSGAIEAENLRGGLQVETFSGTATVRMPVLTDDLQFSSFSGNVELYLPADADFEIDAEEGIVDERSSEFALQTEEDGRQITGDGNPRIQMETFSGALHLHTL